MVQKSDVHELYKKKKKVKTVFLKYSISADEKKILSLSKLLEVYINWKHLLHLCQLLLWSEKHSSRYADVSQF